MHRNLAADAVVAEAVLYASGGSATARPTSITWTFPSTDVPARQLVLAALQAADRLDPGGWVTNVDDYSVRGPAPNGLTARGQRANTRRPDKGGRPPGGTVMDGLRPAASLQAAPRIVRGRPSPSKASKILPKCSAGSILGLPPCSRSVWTPPGGLTAAG
jgi:hypothetical protein